jgi:hypothetical protein
MFRKRTFTASCVAGGAGGTLFAKVPASASVSGMLVFEVDDGEYPHLGCPYGETHAAIA